MDSIAFRANISTIAYGDTVWVAKGVYHPNLSNSNNCFQIPSGVRVYGGFAGNETALSQRNIHTNRTILDGKGANSLVHFFNVDSTTVIDGFTLSNGYGFHFGNYGGAIYNVARGGNSKPIISNDSFANNYANFGGAISDSANGGKANPTITYCSFTNNSATIDAGAIYNFGAGSNNASNAVITNCTFYNNSSLNDAGTIMNITNSSGQSNSTITDCIFNGNSCQGTGPAILNQGNMHLTNCLFINNTGADEGALFSSQTSTASVITNCTFAYNTYTNSVNAATYFDVGHTLITNCIFWDSVSYELGGNANADTIYYSDIKGGWTGKGGNNININPHFVSHANAQLSQGSLCVNTGSNADVASGITTDLAGNVRIQKGTVDMGAYESPYVPLTRFYVTLGGAGNKSGATWTNAMDSAAFYTNLSLTAYHDTFWVAAGTYHPTLTSASNSFTIPSGVAVYGGFAGTETVLSQRNASTNVTILDGHKTNVVVKISNADSTTVLNGFTISNGYATQYGGGIYNLANGVSCIPVITDCIFSGNSAYMAAGAMLNQSQGGKCAPAVTNCVFINNTAPYIAAVYEAGSATVYTNCSFSGNTSTAYGVVYSQSAIPSFTNCILWDNISGEIGGQAIVNYSDVYGGYTGTGSSNNIKSNPLFVSNTNLQLTALSPCVNTGINAAVLTSITTDLAGNTRIQKGTVDMGAYESPYTPVITHYYVTPGGAGAKTGSSWANAMDSVAFRTNISTAVYHDTFWLAKGTYHPNLANDSNKFVIPSGVAVYGGFSGTETSFSQRSYRTNRTILDGNSTIYNIVYLNNVDSTTVLDGFTVSNSNNSTSGTGGIGGNYAGGAIYINGSISGSRCNPQIANDSFVNNFVGADGGAIFNYAYNNGTTKAAITNCAFVNNSTDDYDNGGGAINNTGITGGNSSPVITDCIFINNAAVDEYAGAIMNNGYYGSSSPVITNCTFINNTAFNGGAIYSTGFRGATSNIVITNCTFKGNTSSYGIITNDENNLTAELTNCIVWDSSAYEIYDDLGATVTVNYTDVYGGWTGTGSNNISGNPLFVSKTNVQLTALSPCVNKGSNAAIPSGITTDLAGNTRIQQGTVDMGAYESSFSSCVTTTSTVNASICAGSSYTFHSKIFSTAGVHLDTLTNKGGCDSIVTINLTIKQPTISNTPVSVCSNQLPYNWNGNNYNTAGRDTVHLINKAGCDSAAILVLTVKHTSTSTTNVSVCPSALPYNWNNTNYSTAGRDTIHLTNKVGCDSVTILVLTLKQTSTSTTNVTVCSSALPYRWNNINYSTGGNYTIHLTNKVGCDSAATLALTITTPATPTVNIVITPDSSIVPGTTVKFTANITYGGTAPKYQWKKNGVNITGATASTYLISSLVNNDVISCVLTSNASCITSATTTSNSIKMTVNSIPCPTVIASPTPVTAQVCSNGSVSFGSASVLGNAIYKWQYTTSNNTTIDSLWHNFGGNSTTATLTGITQKTYARIVVTVPGCAVASSATSIVNIDSTSLNVTATNITTNSATLNWNAITGATYSVTVNGHTYNTGTNSYAVTGLSGCHTYTATVTATGGNCGGTPTGNANITTLTSSLALTLSAGIGASIKAAWAAGVGPYKVYYTNMLSPQNATAVNVTGTSYTIGNSTSGSSYLVYVIDQGSTCNPKAQTNTAYFNVAGAVCSNIAPVISNVAPTATSITVSWTGNAAGYQFCYKSPTGSWNNLPVTGNSYTLTGATPNTCYMCYVVNRCSATSFGYCSNIDTVCTPNVCTNPLNLILSKPTCKGFTATWSPSVGVSTYQIYISTTNGTGTPWNISYPPASTSYTASIYTPGTTAIVYIKANCTNGGQSISSNMEMITTLTIGCKDGEEINGSSYGSSSYIDGISIYPNPNNGEYTISMQTISTENTAKVQVMNLLGQVMVESYVANNNGTIHTTINNTNLAAGVYVVRVLVGGETYNARMVVTH